MENYTRAQITALLDVEGDGNKAYVRGAKRMMDRWFERGDGVAVYRNEDLGHRDMGRLKFVSFGGPSAYLPDPPPPRLPDTPEEINWRFVLIGTHRKET